MKVFKSVLEMDSTFRAYIEEVRGDTLASLVEACADSIENKYRNLPYPLEINGERVSKVPPQEIAAAVRSSVSTDSGMIYVDPDAIEAHWSARRYAALTSNGNPFASLLQELKAGAKMVEVTGLKTHP